MNIVNLELSSENNISTAFLASVPLEMYCQILAIKESVLHKNELEYFKGLKYYKRQKSYLVGRYACKSVLSQFFIEPNYGQIEIDSGIFGQPLIRYLSRETGNVSLSHNDKYAVAIACSERYPMAIDIETADVNKVSIIRSQLTDEEELLVKSDIYPEYVIITVLWTVKEALSKVIKCGLTIPLEILEVYRPQIVKDCLILEFKNFPQYHAYTWIVNDQVMSIVYPKNINITVESCGIHKIISDN